MAKINKFGLANSLLRFANGYMADPNGNPACGILCVSHQTNTWGIVH